MPNKDTMPYLRSNNKGQKLKKYLDEIYNKIMASRTNAQINFFIIGVKYLMRLDDVMNNALKGSWGKQGLQFIDYN